MLRLLPTALLLAALVGVSPAHARQPEAELRDDLEASRPGSLQTGDMASRNGVTPDHDGVVPDWDSVTNGDPTSVLSSYTAYALATRPEILAAFSRWEASIHAVARQRRLPDPTLSAAYFIRSVETRVGPQRARLSLQQAFPWPGELTAGVDAASLQARAAQRQFDALTLTVTAEVAEAYWSLWELRQTREIHEVHLTVLNTLSSTSKGQVTAGSGTFAALQQVDLAAARLRDRIDAMDELESSLQWWLRGVLGVQEPHPLPTTTPPPAATLPAEPTDALAADARQHPKIDAIGLQAEAWDHLARKEAAARAPDFKVGLDWIITDAIDPSLTHGGTAPPDAGQDAVALGVGLSIPLWQRNTTRAVDAARAQQSALGYDQRAAENANLAAFGRSLSALRDAARRVDTYNAVLIPQAETTLSSTLSAYATGHVDIAATLRAQEELLDLRTQLVRAQADHARAWAALEQAVGRPVPSTAESAP